MNSKENHTTPQSIAHLPQWLLNSAVY